MIREMIAVAAVAVEAAGLVVGGAGRWSSVIPVRLEVVRWTGREWLCRTWVGLVFGLQKGAELLDINFNKPIRNLIIATVRHTKQLQLTH